MASGKLPSTFVEPGFEDLLERLADNPGEEIQDRDTRVRRVRHGGAAWIVRTIGSEDPYAEGSWDETRAEGLSQRIHALALGLGIRGLETMVSYSLEEPTQPVVVTRNVAGVTLDKLPASQVRAITKTQLRAFLTTIEKAASRNLKLDAITPSNSLYSRRHGLAAVDYDIRASFVPAESILPDCEFLDVLRSASRKLSATDTLSRQQAWTNVIYRGMDVLKERYPQYA